MGFPWLSSEGFSQTCFLGEIQTVFTSAFDVKQKVLLFPSLRALVWFLLAVMRRFPLLNRAIQHRSFNRGAAERALRADNQLGSLPDPHPYELYSVTTHPATVQF